ncbi:MAG TPA: hypothetical protein VGI44_03415 [Acidimicrobiales bacterium]
MSSATAMVNAITVAHDLAVAGLVAAVVTEVSSQECRWPADTVRFEIREVSLKVLLVAWDSGGGVEVVESAVRRTVICGHRVRALGTDGLRVGLEAGGAAFRPYPYAPDNDRNRASATPW